MLDLGPYSEFIIAAYSISAITLLTLTIWVHKSEAYHKKMLSMFEDDSSQKEDKK